MIDKKELKIDVPFDECSTKRNIDLKEAFITLDSEFVRYKIVASYESFDDDMTIWKKEKSNWRFSRKRDDICGVNMIYYSEDNYYSVEIDFYSFGTPLGWKFTDPKKGLDLYNTLLDYFERRTL